jgi:hypothetical protein
MIRLTAQTDIKATGETSTDDFLARERALLGDDATQFTTNNDSSAFAEPSNDDLLGGGGDSSGAAQFESQFPDISSGGNEVSS